MKQFLSIIVSLLLVVPLYAIAPLTSKQQVNRLVQRVKESQGDERRKAMNALKIALRSMNQTLRQHAIMKLRHHSGGRDSRGLLHRGGFSHTVHKVDLSTKQHHEAPFRQTHKKSQPKQSPHQSPMRHLKEQRGLE